MTSQPTDRQAQAVRVRAAALRAPGTPGEDLAEAAAALEAVDRVEGVYTKWMAATVNLDEVSPDSIEMLLADLSLALYDA